MGKKFKKEVRVKKGKSMEVLIGMVVYAYPERHYHHNFPPLIEIIPESLRSQLRGIVFKKITSNNIVSIFLVSKLSNLWQDRRSMTSSYDYEVFSILNLCKYVTLHLKHFVGVFVELFLALKHFVELFMFFDFV